MNRPKILGTVAVAMTLLLSTACTEYTHLDHVRYLVDTYSQALSDDPSAYRLRDAKHGLSLALDECSEVSTSGKPACYALTDFLRADIASTVVK